MKRDTRKRIRHRAEYGRKYREKNKARLRQQYLEKAKAPEFKAAQKRWKQNATIRKRIERSLRPEKVRKTAEEIRITKKEYGRKYFLKNRERIRIMINERNQNPVNKLINSYRNGIRKSLLGIKKHKPSLQLLGCTIVELRNKFKREFKPGMTWKNYGKVWHIDHIIPIAKFDLTKADDQKTCFHYTNLQPLFAMENISKGDKILSPVQMKIAM